jgi:hypothetical protein
LSARLHLAWLAAAAIAAPLLCDAQTKATSKQTYKWVDDKGEVHYGDSVPPEFAKKDRTILNNQGVNIGTEEGEITPERRAEMKRKADEAEAARIEREKIQKRDNMLLETYLSVRDIEELRDRRLELLESQIKVTELYLANLRKRLVALQEEAGNYKPYTAREGAPQIPENLALDLSRTLKSINLYEQTLSTTRDQQNQLRDEFDSDIRRFKEIKKG